MRYILTHFSILSPSQHKDKSNFLMCNAISSTNLPHGVCYNDKDM